MTVALAGDGHSAFMVSTNKVIIIIIIILSIYFISSTPFRREWLTVLDIPLSAIVIIAFLSLFVNKDKRFFYAQKKVLTKYLDYRII